MKLGKILRWLDDLLEVERFDDVSNNGLQIARTGDDVTKVAFAVDGSVKSLKAASEAGAQLLVVHHGISWGGGIKRITEGEYNVVKAAMESNLALYASHLPLDANKRCGNNWEIARSMKLRQIKSAFSYHGNIIGVVGVDPQGRKIGVCSGGAGSFAPEAKQLGCELFVTGEADWGEVIAAENVGMKMECRGHYETETFGVKALMREMRRALKIGTVFVSLMLGLRVSAEVTESSEGTAWYVGANAALVLPQGGEGMSRLGGGAIRLGAYLTETLAIEGEAAWMENRCGMALQGLWHWNGCELYNQLFGYERYDPFFTFGARGWINDAQVGPALGVGTFYYLDDNWALRFDANYTLGIESEIESVFSLSAGVQYVF